MNTPIYLDNQATTQIDPSVLAEMLPFFGPSFGNPHSRDHVIGWLAAQAIEESVNHIGNLIGADEDEVLFTSGATEANNLALLGIGKKASAGKRNRVLMSSIEHKCVLEASSCLQRQLGYSVDTIPVDEVGFVDLDYLENSLSDDVLLVSIILVNNEIGTIQDIATISDLVHKHGALLHSDAAQAPTALELKDIADFTDLMSLSSHKMYGPQGIGMLYIRREIQNLVEPIIYGGGQQQGIRSGTLPLPLCIGMGAAAKRMLIQGETERESVRMRSEKFIELLSKLSNSVELNGPLGFRERHPGNANVQFVGFDATDILSALQPHVAASTGSACTTGLPETSHVLHSIGLNHKESSSSVRFSLGKDTTDEEIISVVQHIDEVLKRIAPTHRRR